jgi:hypothetical protein
LYPSAFAVHEIAEVPKIHDHINPRTTTRRFPTPWRPDKMLGGYVVCDAARRSGDGGFLPLCRFAARPRSVRRVPRTPPRDAGEPLMAIVSIKSQHVTIYDAEGWILRAPVSSGTTGRETPAGVFSVAAQAERAQD